ncbi:ATP-binding cassette domain-containing protein [Nocardioides panacisoli]|uniref:iron ABC transporter ATP-binding protein n=1 Tax=Nocardioides panacisoli TaxID=627624 RepID=UPI001C639A78|nr:ATP-binding cassette domain-containing protein [Nocardioides panacisoli]QYJ02800.1 ATP-binding cassette domain-containing protein [Nocardioides panacisoli]
MITVEALRKSYGDRPVVADLTLTLPESGVTAVIGPNGAGKSTLVSLISRILGADAGRVHADELDVFGSPSRQVARKLSILRQEHHTTARITVRELVEFGRFPHSRGRLTPTCRAAVAEALDYCDLGDLADRPIHQLSGGQRQRAHVAMVLAQDTHYVLLDEPLNNLDMAHATGVMRLLRRLADERGKSIVLVLHDINYASVHADRIIAMRDGVVVHDGPPELVIDAEVLEDVYGMPFAVHRLGPDRIATYFR